MLSTIGVTLRIGGPVVGAVSAGLRGFEYYAGNISGRDLALGLLADAAMGAGFWGVGKGVGWAASKLSGVGAGALTGAATLSGGDGKG
jgi:hypothetical protein